MKAVRIHEYGDATTLKLEEVPRHSPGTSQILVRIAIAGVNPVDWKIRRGYLKDVRPAAFPLAMGQDFAGEVVELGPAVKEFNVSDRVFGFARGSYAEYATAPVSAVARIPETMDFATAAALPTTGLTALQLVRDLIQARPGMTILIQGAAGGVGSIATQIAIHHGARVFATAAGADIEYLRWLGVEEAINYQQERFEDKVHDVDAVIDLVGGETLNRSYAVVKKGGVLATTVQPVDEQRAQRYGISAVQMLMQRNAADLAELAQLVAQGVVKPRVAQIINLSEARKAQELIETGKVHGKIILKVA